MASESSRKLIFRIAARALCVIIALAGVVPAAEAGVGIPVCRSSPGGTAPLDVYVPMDSWIYGALDRLHGLGFADTAFLGVRPWTKRSIQRMADEAGQADEIANNPQAIEIVAAARREFGSGGTSASDSAFGCEAVYTRLQGIGGLTLRDSFHLGQTVVNDYGRPYQPGFNTVDGMSGSAQYGRFSLYVRGEYQHAPGAAGYSPAFAATLSNIDMVPLVSNPVQATIPMGPIERTNDFRLLEANLSYRILDHQISFGKSDHWLAPTVGGAFLYSNNAENIYAFQIDRTEPLYIPLLSRLTGPFRYDFFVGSLKGHTDPNDPWIHVEKINFKPTANVEFGFERSVIWGGKGHEPVNLKSFLRSFLSTTAVSPADKLSPQDPGARFSSFEFNWRLPWLNHWLTLYTDSLIHDDINPIDAPRHAGVRPGLYLSRIPGIPRLDLRFEGVNTDPETSRSAGGSYLYTEFVQKQGYTNKGFIMGDAIGREAQGGQAWLTYHLSPREMIQTSFRHSKVADDFIPLGTTQNSFDVRVVKRFHDDFEILAEVQQEWWKAPVYKPGLQMDTVATFQLTLYPQRPAR